MKYPPLLPYIEKYMIKANPSPKGNGFAFNLFGDSKGIALQRLPIGNGEARGASVQSRAACRGLRSNTHNRGEIPRKNTDECNVRILVTPRGIEPLLPP